MNIDDPCKSPSQAGRSSVSRSSTDGATTNTAAADLALVRRAIAGDSLARGEIYDRIEPMIRRKNREFCLGRCTCNYVSSVRCSVDDERARRARANTPLCEVGHASLCWMLEQLAGPSRLGKYDGRNGAQLTTYLTRIANDPRFHKQWLDWRRGRRIVVPAYIKDLHVHAEKVFWWMCDNHPVPNIAGRLQADEGEIRVLCTTIKRELEQRGNLRLLYPAEEISLTGFRASSDADDAQTTLEWDVPAEDSNPENREILEQVQRTLNEMLASGEIDWVSREIYLRFTLEGWTADEVQHWLRENKDSLKSDSDASSFTHTDIYAVSDKVRKKLVSKIDFD